MNKNKIQSLLGLAAKAGKVVSGEFSTEKAVKSKMALVVVLAGDASENTKKKFSNMCHFYEVPMIFAGDRQELGKCIGKEFRASLAVLDENFAKAIMKNYPSQD